MSLWIFGYGSLLFRPDFPHEERVPARVSGWMRRLDQGSPDHRGTPARLGRVATLVPAPGEVAVGAAYRVAARDVAEVLRVLDHREQGGYERVELEVTLATPTRAVRATTWIAQAGNPWHLGPLPLAAMVEQIRAATGPSGPNVEYVLRLAETLRALDALDPHVAELERALLER